MNKQEVYEFLDKRGAAYEKTEHPAVFSMKEVPAVELPPSGSRCQKPLCPGR